MPAAILSTVGEDPVALKSGTDHRTIKFNCLLSHKARKAVQHNRSPIAPIDPSDALAKSNRERFPVCAASAGPRKKSALSKMAPPKT